MFNPSATESLARERVRDRMRKADRADAVHREVATALAYAPLFSQCSKRELRLVAKVAKTKNVRTGVVLTVEGEQGDSMFVLLSGHAVVRKGGKKIADLRAGDVVGELALLARAPRNATVTTTSQSEVATIGRRDLGRLLEEAPGFSKKLLEALAMRIRDLDKRVVG